jgi:hypothetical protein
MKVARNNFQEKAENRLFTQTKHHSAPEEPGKKPYDSTENLHNRPDDSGKCESEYIILHRQAMKNV